MNKTNHIEIPHPDKIMFPQLGKTKQDVADYYHNIASHLLPYIKHRPLTLIRYPQGIAKNGFYNKHIPEHFPDFIQRIKVPMRSQEKDMIMAGADQPEDLMYFVGQDVIELHMPLSKEGKLEYPDQIIFDFDPSEGFEEVRTAALEMKTLLDEGKITSFIKTTGSRGVHIHIPLKPKAQFSEVKDVAHHLAQVLVSRLPEITTLEQRKEKRGKKVFIDYLRNEYAMTAVVPYSLRAKEKAPIAAPIAWDELANKSIDAQSFTIDNIFHRISQIKDPWAEFSQKTITLAAFKQLT